MRMTVREIRDGLTVAIAAGALAALGACERADDRLAVQIDRASHQMSMTAAAGLAMTPDERSSAYGKVISELNGALDGASDENKAIAQLIMARAKLGQATIAAADTADQIAELTHKVTYVRSIEARLRTQLSVAESLAGFDPQETLALIDQRSEELDAELAQAQSGLDELVALQAEVQARQDAENEGARAEREFEQALRNQALRADGQQRLSFVSQAVSHERAASQHEKRAAEIGLELATVNRAVDDRRREVQTLARIRQVQDDTRDRIAASQSGWGAQRAQAIDDAKASAAEASETLAQIQAMLDDAVTPALDQTASAFQGAISDARKAQSSFRTAAGAVSGTAQHGLADLQSGMAQVLGSLADVVERLQSVSDVKVSGLDAQALQARADEARDAASSALESAASAFGSAGGDLGEVRDLIEQATAEPEPEPEPAPEEPADEA